MATRTWDARTLPDERVRSNACVTVVNTVPVWHTPRRDAGRPPELRVAPALPFGMTGGATAFEVRVDAPRGGGGQPRRGKAQPLTDEG